MKKILKNIKRGFSHFQAKLLAAFLLCTLIPLGIIGGISYSVSYSIARDRILNASMSSDEQLNMQINERLEQVENVADSLQYDMYALMQADTPMDSLSSLTDTRNDVSLFKATFRLFYASVFLPQDHLGAGEGLYFFPLTDLEKYALPVESLENPGTSSIWFYQEKVTVPVMISSVQNSRSCAACCRILKDTETQVIEYAYIIFLDVSDFSQYLEESFSDKNISSYIVTDQGQPIAHNSPDQPVDIDQEKLSDLAKEEGTLYQKDQVSYHTVRLQNGWYHITEIPDSYIRNNVYILVKTILITLLCSLPLTILVIIAISRSLTRKIRILSTAMKEFKLDAPGKEIQELISPAKDPDTYDEIDKLGLTFQKMQASLSSNMQSILDLSLTEERLKYQLLQSQINPHFLYNILGSIQTCQSLGKLDIANEMITNLTRFYRMTLRKSGDLITIRDELEIARLYLKIEKLCHNDNLSWEIDLEDGIENFLICKFTLQPFLENSILHGLSQRTPQVHIVITAVYGDDTVIITIADNGAGIGEKQLAEIRHTLDSKIVDYEKHFGIGNVNKRISNPYFGNGHISIDSRLYHGTKITIEFNQMEEENEESNDC